jgi:hypothetical protein
MTFRYGGCFLHLYVKRTGCGQEVGQRADGRARRVAVMIRAARLKEAARLDVGAGM